MGRSVLFPLFHSSVQKWVREQRWASLRGIQEDSGLAILNADRDVIISASTASGKTEAAFLPAVSYVCNQKKDKLSIIYVSPIKALINDQTRRLESLSIMSGLPITPWHGDISQSKKDAFRANPRGILLITPESLESMLMIHGTWCEDAFSDLCFLILDEFHSFIGTERGAQLMSLCCRIEHLTKRFIPRIALSATLGELDLVERYLRPPSVHFPCQTFTSNFQRADLLAQLRGYEQDQNLENPALTEELVDDMASILRGKSNLIFANTRANTEVLASKLAEYCEARYLPNEFFPHHGSLSKDFRYDVEARLLDGKMPTSAVCTMTLEMGIDIGHVDAVAQVSPPYSVASMRQRVGRSGRKNEVSIIYLFISERKMDPDLPITEALRLQTFQSLAMLNLMVARWYEPPLEQTYHFSTLIQQILSLIAQYGSAQADQLWDLLCKKGPFFTVSDDDFVAILRSLGEAKLIQQLHDGQLMLGEKGDLLVASHKFLTAFQTSESFDLVCENQTIGSIPAESLLRPGQSLIFSGKKWRVVGLNFQKRCVQLEPGTASRPPLFYGTSRTIHDKVRQEMYNLYVSGEFLPVLDKQGKQFANEGLETFRRHRLFERSYLVEKSGVYLFPWGGDCMTNTIRELFLRQDLSVSSSHGIIHVACSDFVKFLSVLSRIVEMGPIPAAQLAESMTDTYLEKYDSYVPDDLRHREFGLKSFDVDGAYEWLKTLWEGI